MFANAETGNIVLLGAHLAEGDFEKALRYLLPIVAFAFGVLSAELVKRRFKSRQNRDINIHWRQIVVLGEMVLVTIAALLPQSANAMVNIIISFVCAMQVAKCAAAPSRPPCARAICVREPSSLSSGGRRETAAPREK